MTMRQMLRKQKEKGGGVVRMPNEPSYHGKSLCEWLAMRKEGWELSTNAVAALRQMGTNVVPALLARLAYKEPVFHLDDPDLSLGAATALIAMGDHAKPALPALAALMDDDNPDLALRAMIATLGTGADAVPCVVKGLTNRFPDVRGEAASFLTEWGAQFPEQCKQAIPYVMRLLDDPDENVRKSATNHLKELDQQAAARAGIR